jgi:hypothetical protein
MNPLPPAITTLSSREVYRNHWMRVREDEILRSNGERGIYGVIDKDDSAIILPIDRGRVWLVEQFRCRRAAGSRQPSTPRSWRAAS